MGKTRIVKPIEDNAKRHTAFTKQRDILFKKASHLSENFAAEVAIITFSRSGNLYGFGDPAVRALVARYLADPSSSAAAPSVGEGGRVCGIAPENVGDSLTNAEKRVMEAVGKGRRAWDLVVENLGLSQLNEMEAVVREVKSVVARAKEAAAHAMASLD